MKRVFNLGISGASGAIYPERLLAFLLDREFHVNLVISPSARTMFEHERSFPFNEDTLLDHLKKSWPEFDCQKGDLRVWPLDNFFSPLASGSSLSDGFLVLPCSMKTVAAIANGVTSNLLERAGDVCLKERKKLVICPRETPYNLIHLRNMQQITEAGGMIMPLSPGFYHKPQSTTDLVDFMLARICDQFGIGHEFQKPWMA